MITYVSAIGEWKQAQSSKEDPHTYDLTGSAIVTGNFYQDTKTHFAMGSPKADKLYGKVYICYDCFNDSRNFNDDVEIFGKNVICPDPEDCGNHHASRFGQALAAVDLDGDGRDELVVGAPFYSSEEKFDIGKIVFYNIKFGTSDESFLQPKTPKTPNLKSESRFGSAISNVGDLQNDGYQDFVVGAPAGGDDGQGVVYVYRGSKDIDDLMNGNSILIQVTQTNS